MAKLPLAFEPNRGQSKTAARYLVHSPGYLLSLQSSSATMQFRDPPSPSKSDALGRPLSISKPQPGNTLTMDLVNANRHAELAGESQLKATASYFNGRDQKDWFVGLPTYAQVNYKSIYPETDLAFYGKDSHLEYDFTLHPGADPGRLQFSLKGVQSAKIDADGNLALNVSGRDVRFLKPVAYLQAKAGEDVKPVGVSYRLSQNRGDDTAQLTFAIGSYDHTQTLVIDPVLDYGMYFSGPYGGVNAATADASGNVYLVILEADLSILKLDPDGELLWTSSVPLSINASIFPSTIAVTSTGAVYVAGTANYDLPTTSNAYQQSDDGSNETFLAVFQPNGSTTAPGVVPSYISYFGSGCGPDTVGDSVSSIAVDSAGDAYLLGNTCGEPFPTSPGAFQTGYPAGATSSGLVVKFDPSKSGASSLVYSTLLGSNSDTFYGIAADTSGNAYITGSWMDPLAPTPGAFAYAGAYGGSGTSSIEVTKLNSTGTALVYNAYLGPGSGNAIALDGAGHVYVTGTTTAADFPTTPGAYQTKYPAGFLTELNPSGSELVDSTFLGGPSGGTNYASVTPSSMALSPGCSSTCNIFIGGTTTEADFPAIEAIQSYQGVSPTGFVVELASNGSPVYSTYLGALNTTTSTIQWIGADSTGNAYVAGSFGTLVNGASSPDFPVTVGAGGPYASQYLARINAAPGTTMVGDPYSVNLGTELLNQSWNLYPGATLRNMGTTPVTLTSIQGSPSQFIASNNCNGVIPGGGECPLTLTFTPTAVGPISGTITVSSTASSKPVTIQVSGTGTNTGLPPAIVVANPTSVNVGSSIVNVTSVLNPAPTVTLHNQGPKAVTLTSLTVTPANEFVMTNNCNGTIAAGGECTLTITAFTPPAPAGPVSGTITVISTASSTPITVQLSGSGADGYYFQYSPSTLTFENQTAGTVSAAQTTTVTNIGDISSPWFGFTEIPSTYVAGTDGCPGNLPPGNYCPAYGLGGSYHETTNCNTAGLNPGQRCQVSVQFAPLQSGSLTSTIYPGEVIDAYFGYVFAAFGQGLPVTGVGTPSSLHIASLSANYGARYANITLSGAGFGASQGSSLIYFNQYRATPIAWSDTRIIVPVPEGASTGNIVVIVGGVSSNYVPFTIEPTPSVTSISPATGPVGVHVIITGQNLLDAEGHGVVWLNTLPVPILSQSNTSIEVQIPSGAISGVFDVHVNGVGISTPVFTVPGSPAQPHLNSLSANYGALYAIITLTGNGFGAVQGPSTISFNGTPATAYVWTNTSITVTVPYRATSGNVVVTVAGQPSNGLPFTLEPTPTVSRVFPLSGSPGTLITISGENLVDAEGHGSIWFGGINAPIVSQSSTNIQGRVPSGAATGPIDVHINGVGNYTPTFTVTN